MHFTYQYTGFSGQWNESGMPSRVCWQLGKPEGTFAGKSGAIQWLHPTKQGEPLPQTPAGQILLAGLVWQPAETLQRMVERIIESLMHDRHQQLASISDNAAGCFIHDGGVYLWVGFASKDSVFFRVDGPRIRWSTNPLDLIEAVSDLDPWALRRCCHGDDVWIYTSPVQRVEQGHLVKIQVDGKRSVQIHDTQFDHFLPDERLVAGIITQESAAQFTREALLHAVRPFAQGEPVGLMLSGGPGSVALLAVMREVGVNVKAYHMESPDPAGSELHFASLACEALEVPLTRITMNTGSAYLSQQWVFSHPYAHPWAQWYQQIAQQAQLDGVHLLVTGGGDDSAFGPGLSYGLHSLFSARIAWRERIKMMRGLLATDWNMFALLRSIRPTRSLIGPSSLAGIKKADSEMRRADFLRPIPPCPRAWDDIALQHAPCFSPQAIALEQAIVRPHGLHLYNPYHQRHIQAISLALPDAYKLMPNLFPHLAPADRVIDKPILRLAFGDMPPEVMWRTWSVWTQAACQMFCLSQKDLLRTHLGKGSCLAALGMADPSRLGQVLESQVLIRENYKTLITSAMVELFLKNAWYPHIKRGGPVWR